MFACADLNGSDRERNLYPFLLIIFVQAFDELVFDQKLVGELASAQDDGENYARIAEGMITNERLELAHTFFDFTHLFSPHLNRNLLDLFQVALITYADLQQHSHLFLRGMVVTSVEPISPAADAGLQAGDVITNVNRQLVSNVAELRSALSLTKERPALLLINRRGTTLYLTMRPGKIGKG
jgi:membrane-associated protease RseP (regulator of RpoE activity)